MVLPLITRTTQEALKTVPDSYRSGASRNRCDEMVHDPDDSPAQRGAGNPDRNHPLHRPHRGRVGGLLFTAGSGFLLPKNLFTKVFESSGTLTIQLYLSMQKAKYDDAFGIAVVLLVIVLGINFLAKYLTRKFDVTKLK